MSKNSKNFVRIDSQGRVHIPGTKATKPRTLIVPKLKQPDKTEIERNYTKSLNRKHGKPKMMAVETEEPHKIKGTEKESGTDNRLHYHLGGVPSNKKRKDKTKNGKTNRTKRVQDKNTQANHSNKKGDNIKITPGVTNPDQINPHNLEELSKNGTPVYDEFGNLDGVIITEKDGSEYYYYNGEYGDGMKQPLYDLEDVERLSNDNVDISHLLEAQNTETEPETETPTIEPDIDDDEFNNWWYEFTNEQPIEEKINKPIVTEENQEEIGILARGYVTIITNFIDNIRGFDFELSVDEKARFDYIYGLWCDALLDPTYMRAFASALEKQSNDMIEQTAVYIFYDEDGIRTSALNEIESFIYSTINSVNEGYEADNSIPSDS